VTGRAWQWFAGLLVGDGVAWLLTLHAQASFRSVAGGPSTTLGIVLGWMVSIGLFIAGVLVVLGSRQGKAYQRQQTRAPARPQDQRNGRTP
jgi:hypothetical protein